MTTSKASVAMASALEVVCLESNPDSVSSVSRCEEEDREWKHDGGQPCMPPVVAGRTCNECQQLGSTRPNSSNN